MIGSKSLLALIQKYITNVYCQSLGSGMPNLWQFFEEFAALFGVMTDQMGVKLGCGSN